MRMVKFQSIKSTFFAFLPWFLASVGALQIVLTHADIAVDGVVLRGVQHHVVGRYPGSMATTSSVPATPGPVGQGVARR